MATITIPQQAPDSFTLSIPKSDVNFFKTMAKKMGWTVKRNKTKEHDVTKSAGYREAMDDIKNGRVYHAESVDDMFKQILG
jgi:hypothetical protein